MHVAQPPPRSMRSASALRASIPGALRPARHNRALGLGAACPGCCARPALAGSGHGKRRTSMRTGRSANGVRMRRRKSGARAAGATLPPPPACWNCFPSRGELQTEGGTLRFGHPTAASAIIAERGDDSVQGPAGRPPLRRSARRRGRCRSCRDGAKPLARHPSLPSHRRCCAACRRCRTQNRSRPRRTVPTSCHWAKHERSFRLISTQRFFNRGSRPERYHGTCRVLCLRASPCSVNSP